MYEDSKLKRREGGGVRITNINNKPLPAKPSSDAYALRFSQSICPTIPWRPPALANIATISAFCQSRDIIDKKIRAWMKLIVDDSIKPELDNLSTA